MNAPKWTPGPWQRVLPVDALGRQPNDWAISDSTGEAWICEDPTWDDEYQQESLANANLIAAAPDLYAALEAAMAFIESHVADPDITVEMVERYAALQATNPKAALSRARGES